MSIDDAAWQRATSEWLVLADSAGHDASVEGANAIKRHTIWLLSALHHASQTKTPSEPGMPPAMIDAHLIASIQVGEDDGMVAVGPTRIASSKNGPYGRIQELGGPSTGHPWMKYKEDGVWYKMHFRELPARPYLKPATEDTIDSGELLQIYWQHWALAQAEVTA